MAKYQKGGIKKGAHRNVSQGREIRNRGEEKCLKELKFIMGVGTKAKGKNYIWFRGRVS